MNTPSVKMTFREWGDVLRIAATIWPQSPKFFDDPAGAGRTPTSTWWAALCQFEADDVLVAMGRLGMRCRFWPSLAEVVETVRDVLAEQEELRRKAGKVGRACLAAPSQETAVGRLAVFDETMAAVAREHGDEVRRFLAKLGDADAAAIDSSAPVAVGPWVQRLRMLIAQGWPETMSIGSDPFIGVTG